MQPLFLSTSKHILRYRESINFEFTFSFRVQRFSGNMQKQDVKALNCTENYPLNKIVFFQPYLKLKRKACL